MPSPSKLIKARVRSKPFFDSLQKELDELNVEVTIPHRVHSLYSRRAKTAQESMTYDNIFRLWNWYKDIINFVRSNTNRSGAFTRFTKQLKRKISGKGNDEALFRAAEDLIKDPIKFGRFGRPTIATLETRKGYGTGPLFNDSGETLKQIKGSYKR